MPSLDFHLPPDQLGHWPKHASWLILGYLLMGLGALLLPSSLRGLVLNALNTILFTQAGWFALARSRKERVALWGWRGLALGLFSQAINQGWATVYMMWYGTPPPFPAAGDLFSILCLALIGLGLLTWPLTSTSGSERLRKGLDGLGAGLSAFFVGWYFAMGPLYRLAGPTFEQRGATSLFFLGNASILGICAYLGARQPSRFRGPLGWISVGFAISLVQATLQVPLALADQYHLGDPLDLLVLLAGLFMLLAPLAPFPLEPGQRPGAEMQDRSPVALILPVLPAATALAFVLGSLVWAPGRLDAVMLTMAMVMAALGLIRGLLTLRDLQRLSTVLESRVEERTRDLETMQEAMLRTERMNAMAVLGAGMAHDLNNTLATIRACAELSLGRLEDGQAVQAKELDHILVAADQSAALTRRLMSYGRTEDEPLKAICLREELSHLETILRMLLRRHVSLRMELGDETMPILGSRAQIEQIFVNLVANARDAMPEGGLIVIRMSRGISAGHPVARVEVEDSGEGMTPEVQAKLFSPFFTTKGQGRGTGLGLASVRQLMQDLGGSLAVSSQPGHGTIFVLGLPLVVD